VYGVEGDVDGEGGAVVVWSELALPGQVVLYHEVQDGPRRLQGRRRRRMNIYSSLVSKLSRYIEFLHFFARPNKVTSLKF